MKQNLNITTFIQSVYTRWNSTYKMMARIYKAFDYISLILMKIDTKIRMLTAAERQAISEVFQVFKPFITATEKLSSESYPTISLLITFTQQIQVELETFQTELTYTHFVIFCRASLI